MALNIRTELTIEGMDCPSCTAKIEGAVCKLQGVENVSLNYSSQKIRFEKAGGDEIEEQVVHAIERLGYKVQRDPKPASRHEAWWQSSKGKLVLFSGALLALAAKSAWILPEFSKPMFALAALVALVPLARKAVMSALAGQPFTIETLVTIAVVGAIIIGEAPEAAIVVFLFLIGELLEMVAAAKARRSVESLADLVPKTAHLVVEGGTREIPADALQVGDMIEVRPGGRVAADGTVVEGESALDEAAITGESIPRHKAPGDTVFAGSINTDGVIRVRVDKAAENTVVARILHLVEEAEASKAPTARFIDEFAKVYTPGVIGVAFLIAVVPPLFFGGDALTWTYKALAILLIGCPCALVLSTPAAITSGISSGARRGLLIKGGAVLEAIGRVRRMAFDKTGTLTRGRPQVTDVIARSGSEDDVLQYSGAVEATSSHPLAKAIVAAAEERGIVLPEVSAAEALNGRGVRAMHNGESIFVVSPRYAEELTGLPTDLGEEIRALEEQGKTVVVVIVGDRLQGIIALRDELRDDARAGVEALRELGVEPVMLTGDNRHTADALAAQLGIEVRAELLPEDKLKEIQRLRSDGTVAMVGDGINDAPALASADVGIAMGGGTDVALETADAALMHQRISDVADLVRLSRATLRNIYQNISVALGLKAVFLITTLLGVTSLWMAILADTGATVLVTLNALRLLGHGSRN